MESTMGKSGEGAVSSEKTKTWVDSLPAPHLGGPQIGDVRNTGQQLERYASHWQGEYNPISKELTLKPAINASIFESDGTFYDSNLATAKNGEIIPNPNSEYIPIKETERRDFIISTENVPLTDNEGNKLIFRGINYEGMREAVQNGNLATGPVMMEHGVRNKVYFAPGSERAFGYAAKGEGYAAMANFDKPSFVVAVKLPADTTPDLYEDFPIEGPIPLDQIKKVYEIRPISIKQGKIPNVIDIRETPGVNVAMMEKLGQKPFMSFPDIFTQLDNAPKGNFAFKEVNMESLKMGFGK